MQTFEECKNLYDDFTDEQKSAYNEYKSKLVLNNEIRAGILTNPIIKHLDTIILKSQFIENVKLYRATLYSTISPYIIDKTYINPEFLSTTPNKSDLFRFIENDGTILEIDCLKRVNYVDMELNHNHNHGECEILLGRNLTFKITENKLLTNQSDINDYIKSLNFLFKVDITSTIRIMKITSLV